MSNQVLCAICYVEQEPDAFASMAEFGCRCVNALVCRACSAKWKRKKPWTCPLCRARMAEFVNGVFPSSPIAEMMPSAENAGVCATMRALYEQARPTHRDFELLSARARACVVCEAVVVCYFASSTLANEYLFLAVALARPNKRGCFRSTLTNDTAVNKFLYCIYHAFSTQFY